MALSLLQVFALLILPKMAYGKQPSTCLAPYTQRGFQLQGHFIKNISATCTSACMQECKLHDQCYSINYQNGKRICELNDGNHLTNPEDFTISPGYDYKNNPARSPSNCSVKFCSRKTDKCLIDRNGQDYKCVSCKDGGGQIITTFPNASVQNKIVLENWFGSLKAFTVCSWNQATSKTEQALFSYATTYHNNEIYVALELRFLATFLRVYMTENSSPIRETEYPTNGRWHHSCVTWQNNDGKLKIYIDGDLKTEGIKNPGRIISGKGAVVLGQDQDKVKGGFQVIQSYQGNLTNVNLWDRVLTSEEVADLSRSCSVGEGNVIKWSDFTARVEGDIQLLCSDDDCGK